MDNESTALSIVGEIPITTGEIVPRYGDDLARAGLAADHASQTDAFA